MDAAGSRVHLDAREGDGEDGGGNPDRGVGAEMTCRIGEPCRLAYSGKDREGAGSRKSGCAVATELRGAGHLPADGSDVAERFVKIVHD